MTPTTTLTSKLTVSFVAAFVATTIALVYVLRAPHIIIQDAALADEYYYVNAGTTLSGDLLAGALLLMAAQYVIYATNVTGSLARIGVVATVVALATIVRHASASESDAKTDPKTGSWYARADIRNTVAYDVIYMVSLYIVMTTLYTYFV
jgi:hypothetical protein